MKLENCLKEIEWLREGYRNVSGTFYKLLAKINPYLFYYVRCRTSSLKHRLNLKHPKTYADKMVWMNFNWRHPLKTKCADKYLVREYVRDCGCEELLVPLIGVWDCVDDIDFDALPNRFAMKCNHGCGWNIICKDKSKLDVKEAKRKLRKWMSKDFGDVELHYRGMKPRIVCEELLDDGVHAAPIDYKLHCIGGKVLCCNAIIDRAEGVYTAKEILLDRDWKRVMLLRREEPANVTCRRPENYDTMVRYAEKLARPFPVVRVDFYYVNGKIYLGELTFTSAGGLGVAFSDEAQRLMGEMIQLPEPI